MPMIRDNARQRETLRITYLHVVEGTDAPNERHAPEVEWCCNDMRKEERFHHVEVGLHSIELICCERDMCGNAVDIAFCPHCGAPVEFVQRGKAIKSTRRAMKETQVVEYAELTATPKEPSKPPEGDQ